MLAVARKILLPCLLVGSCAGDYRWDGSLESLLLAQPERFASVMENVAAHRV
jgi:hypothetical protein